MKVGTSIMIFFLAIIALVAEFILYILFGFGFAFSGDLSALTRTAFFFVSLMVLTAAIGILAPLCALVELGTKKKNISLYIMLPILGLILGGLAVFGVVGMREVRTATETKSPVKIESSDKEKTAYFEKILVRRVHIGESILDETGVFGEIKNTGDRTLSKVEITIYCLDRNGKPIFEKTYHPVLVSEWSITDNQPLKPNYSRKFGVKLDDAPSDWARKVKVEVTDVEFEHQ